MSRSSPKQLSVFGLVMINVIAIDSLRTLPIGAEYGFSLVFYYLVAAVVFFIPAALVAAELATGWPETGGIYIWAREAFGKRIGFLTIWLQWFYNICWYPTIMTLIAATLAYCINPQLVNNKLYMSSIILVIFWLSTWLNFFGMRATHVLSTISAIIGTILPMLFITLLGIIWVSMGKPMSINLSWHDFFPHGNSINHLVLLTGLLYGLVGMELSASHAGEVHDPQRDYPKAVLWSAIIILSTLIFSSLSIALVIPQQQLNIVSGLLQAFTAFFSAFHMAWFMPVLALLIVIGALGGMNAWILGPSKGLLMASRDGSLPAFLRQTNQKHVPVRILLLQAIIFTILCSVFIFLPTVSSSFWVLTAITSILSLIVYVIMFSAAIRLRYRHPDVKRTFMIPGGKLGLWISCLLGLISCLFTLFVGFFPPSQIAVGNLFIYESILIIGVLLGCAVPFAIYHWNHCLEDKKAA